MKIIETKTEKLTFVGNQRERVALVKLQGAEKRYTLLSMGDGINRLLIAILAAVNTDNGVLIIDEFENGLHYSVQESLWRMIFNLSKRHSIQIFVTTHSSDCIKACELTQKEPEYKNMGSFYRLENSDGVIEAIDYETSEVLLAIENNIEVR